MKRNLGRKSQSNPVPGSMSTLHAIAQPASPYQVSDLLSRDCFAAQPARNITTISDTATHEMMRLKAS